MFDYSSLKFHEGSNCRSDVSNRYQLHNFRNSILKIPKSGQLHLITVTSKVHRKPSIALFTVTFSHLHDNVFERGCEAISGNSEVFARNRLTSTLKYIVMQMSKGNCEKGYSIVTRRVLRYLNTSLYSFTKHYVAYAQNEMCIGSGLENNASEPGPAIPVADPGHDKTNLRVSGGMVVRGCPHHSSMVESPVILADPTFLHNCCSAINIEDLKSVFLTFSLFSAVLPTTIEKIINCSRHVHCMSLAKTRIRSPYVSLLGETIMQLHVKD